MARTTKLKVYRTAIGFHDAYVAAPNQKAALEAWGSDKDLFARGVAELVTDAALAADALAAPGTVMKRLRGTMDEQLAALPPEKPRRAPTAKEAEDPLPSPPRKRRAAAPSRPQAERARREMGESAAPASTAPEPVLRRRSKVSRPEPAPKPKPRPSRAALDEAEHAIAAAEEQHAAEMAELLRREEALATERRKLERRQEDERRALDQALDAADRAFKKALTAWAARG